VIAGFFKWDFYSCKISLLTVAPSLWNSRACCLVIC